MHNTTEKPGNWSTTRFVDKPSNQCLLNHPGDNSKPHHPLPPLPLLLLFEAAAALATGGRPISSPCVFYWLKVMGFPVAGSTTP